MKYTFRFKILIIMITAILIPVVFLSIFITYNSKQYYENFIVPEVENNVSKEIEQVEKFFINSKNELNMYCSILEVSDNEEYIFDNLDQLLSNNPTFINTYYSDETGNNYLDHNRNPIVDGRDRDWYKSAKEMNGFSITAPYIDVITNEWVVTLSSPVIKEGVLKGVLGVDFLISDVVKNISKSTRLSDPHYIARNSIGEIIYRDNSIESNEVAEALINQATVDDNLNTKYFYLSEIQVQLHVVYTSAAYNSEMLSIGYEMAILFVFVVFITIVFAFSGAQKLSEPLKNFKEKIKLTIEPHSHDISEQEMHTWDEEFYVLFSKFDKLSKKIRLDEVKLSKRVKVLQEKNNELMDKNIDLELIYRNLKQIEKKVRKSRKEYESILENIKGLIWVLNAQGEIVFVNTMLENQLNFDSNALINGDMSLIIDNTYSDQLSLLELISNRDFKKIELNLINSSNEKFLVEASTSRVLDDSGSLLFIYGICRSVHEVKELHYNYNVKIQEQNLIMDLTETASMNVSMNQVTKTIFDKINSIFGWSVGTIRFLNENNEFELIARTDVGTDYIVSQSLDYENSCLTYVIDKNEILYINSTDELPIKEEIYCQIIEDGYSLIFIPVGNNDIGRGVISLTIDRISMIEKEEILRSFTNTILIVVERALIYEKLKKDYIRMIKVLAEAGDDKDSSSVGHSNRVASYCKKIGEHLYLDDEEIINIEICGLLHDIGKIGISDEYLSKVSQLTAIGIEKVKEHPNIGRKMLEGIGLSEQILDGIEMHHMNFDLSGYPSSELLENLPLFPRIIQVADSFDNHRINSPEMSNSNIWEMMHQLTGKTYCPKIMKALKDIIGNNLI